MNVITRGTAVTFKDLQSESFLNYYSRLSSKCSPKGIQKINRHYSIDFSVAKVKLAGSKTNLSLKILI